MTITAKRIAEIAGVSRGTVDRALNNRPGVNPETKKLILKIAQDNDYKPNLIGKALVYSSKDLPIEIILNSVGNAFFNDVKKGIFQAQSDYSDYGLKIHLTELKGYDESEMLSALNAVPKDVKNIIITPISSPIIENKLFELSKDGKNIITLSSDTHKKDRLSYVGCDYKKSGKIMGRLVGLLSGGSCNISIVTGSLKHEGHKQRVNGILEILDSYPQINVCSICENDDDDSIAYQKLRDLLKADEKINFVCITAGGVKGSIKAINESQRELKICCFDETPASKEALINGNISAIVCQQPFNQGYNAVKTVFDTVIANTDVKSYQFTDLNIKVDQSI